MKSRDASLWLFAATGVLGGYTTFSTLANDSWQLLLNNHPGIALLNAAGSIIAGIAAPVAFEGWTTSDSGPRSKAQAVFHHIPRLQVVRQVDGAEVVAQRRPRARCGRRRRFGPACSGWP